MTGIKRFFRNNLLWVIFLVFACIGVATKKDTSIFISQSQYGTGKYCIWLLFFGFFSYTFFASRKENFYKSIRHISHWHHSTLVNNLPARGYIHSVDMAFSSSYQCKSVYFAILCVKLRLHHRSFYSAVGCFHPTVFGRINWPLWGEDVRRKRLTARKDLRQWGFTPPKALLH
jgi:hypothetical protein